MSKRIYLLSFIVLFGSCISPAGLSWRDYFRITKGQRGTEIPYSLTGIDLRGKPAEIGRKMGAFFRNDPVREGQLRDILRFRRFQPGDPERVSELLRHHFPHLLPEIAALADEIGMDESVLLGIAGARFQIGGCSILALSSPVPRLIRNYDWTPTLSENLIVSIGSAPGRLASIGIGEGFFGRLSGINEAGVVVAIAAVPSTKEYGEVRGLAMPVLVRGVLDRARNTEEAIRLLQTIPHSSTYNYGIVDAAGRTAIVETTPEEVTVRRGKRNGFLATTNHFQSLSNKKHQVRVFKNSLKRLERLEGLHASNPRNDARKLFAFFGNSETGIAMHHYSGIFGTLWTVMYEPKSRSMRIRAGTDGATGIYTVGSFRFRELNATLRDDGGFPE